jgi:hypothetical protein
MAIPSGRLIPRLLRQRSCRVRRVPSKAATLVVRSVGLDWTTARASIDRPERGRLVRQLQEMCIDCPARPAFQPSQQPDISIGQVKAFASRWRRAHGRHALVDAHDLRQLAGEIDGHSIAAAQQNPDALAARRPVSTRHECRKSSRPTRLRNHAQ